MKGRNKLLLPVNDIPMILALSDAVGAAGYSPVLVVTGYDEGNIHRALKNKNVIFVHNKDWESGMSSSIIAAVSALPPAARGILIVLGDMPLIRVETLQRLKYVFEATGTRKIVYPTYEGQQANPVLFPKKHFEEILTIRDDRGCKSIVERYARESIAVPIASNEVIMDCDTEDDYLRILKEQRGKKVATG